MVGFTRVTLASLVAAVMLLSMAAPGAWAAESGRLSGRVSAVRDADGHYRLTARYARKHPKLMAAVRTALAQRGKRYRWGAEGPRRYDCSGLVVYSYGRAGLELPRTSRAQARAVHRIAKRDLRRGDLLFFHKGKKKRVYHVGIFLAWKDGRPLMVHSPKPGERVRRNVPWTTRWWGGTLRRVR